MKKKILFMASVATMILTICSCGSTRSGSGGYDTGIDDFWLGELRKSNNYFNGYQIETLSPSLSPIKVKENTKKISGQRVKCLVSLLYKDKLYYSEEGEVLFKDDGLSGIIMLNMSQKINELDDKKAVKIVLNLAPNHKVKQDQYLEFVHPKVATYLTENNLSINNLVFSFKNFYDFNIAEVSHGGVSLKEITSDLESKKERGLYFAGEVLDIDGMCGGYNLMFAFDAAETVAKAIKKGN